MIPTHKRLATNAAVALALALAAIAAPAAEASYPAGDRPVPQVQATVDQGSPNGPAGAEAVHRRAIDQAPVVRTSKNGGFHWGDAGIGAASGLAIALTALGLTLLFREHVGSSRSAPSGPQMQGRRIP